MSDSGTAYQIPEYMSVVGDHSKSFCLHTILCKTHHHCHNRHHQPTRTLHHPVRWCFPAKPRQTYRYIYLALVTGTGSLLTQCFFLSCFVQECMWRNTYRHINWYLPASDVVRRCPMLKVKHPDETWFLMPKKCASCTGNIEIFEVSPNNLVAWTGWRWGIWTTCLL